MLKLMFSFVFDLFFQGYDMLDMFCALVWQIPKAIRGAVIGNLLGDAHLRPGTGSKDGVRRGSGRLSVTYGIDQQIYMEHLHGMV